MPDDDLERMTAERREHIDSAEAEARAERNTHDLFHETFEAPVVVTETRPSIVSQHSAYETLLDVAQMTLGYALEHPDCPDFHRAMLERLRGELEAMYGAVLANKGLVDDTAPRGPDARSDQ